MKNSLYETAFKLLSLGYSVIPSGSGDKGKAPLVNWSDYQNTPADETQLERWQQELKPKLWGIVTNGKVAVIDADTAETREALTKELGQPHVSTPRGGAHWYINTQGHPMKTAAGVLPGIDCRGVGGFVNIAGGEYTIQTLPLSETLISFESLPQSLKNACNGSGKTTALVPSVTGKPIPLGQRNATLTRIAGAMRRQGAEQDAIIAALINIRCETPLPEEEIQSIAASICTYTPQPDGGAPAAFHLTDYGNALRMAAQHGKNIRYSPERKMWLIWTGKVWEWDLGGIKIGRLAKKVTMSIYGEASEEANDEHRKNLAKHARETERQVRLDAMIKSAENEPGIAVMLSELDAHHCLLNVANGTVNLKTGVVKRHDPADLLTEILSVTYDPDARSAEWDNFLLRIFAGDEALVSFVRRSLGYSITGDQSEQVFFFCYGRGFNGKSTLLNACRLVMGDYASQIPPTAFMVDKTKRGGPDEAISSLKNKRLVCSTELEDKQKLSVSLVKRMTGGEPLWCEHKFEHGYNFQPTHKLWLSGNHEPVITDTTNSIWFRLKKIPFTIEIPEDERRKGFAEKLAADHAAAILAWLVKGCVEWATAGDLGEPAVVKEAVAVYREQQDILHDYLLERCLIKRGEFITSTDLYDDYKKWAAVNADITIGRNTFGDRLAERGFPKGVRGNKNKPIWPGIRLLTSEESVTFDTFDTEIPKVLSRGPHEKNFTEKGNKVNKSNKSGLFPVQKGTDDEENPEVTFDTFVTVASYPENPCVQCGKEEPIVDEKTGAYKCVECGRFYPNVKKVASPPMAAGDGEK